MKIMPRRQPSVGARVPSCLAAAGLVVLLAVAGTACTDATIQNGGAGGTGKGGTGSGTIGSGGVSIDISSKPLGSGGTSGNLCNSIATQGCKTQIPEGCGDGINNQGGIEVCDDGNVLPGDGCNGACKVEKNWECPKQGKCTRLIVCGDKQIGAGEVCDDGNTVDNDGCNATCTVQDPAFTCIPGEPCVRSSECGNKRIEAGEDCEDGNTKDGDGCSSSCKLEGGWVCPNPGLPCKQAPRCGDSVMQPSNGEVCDDGNKADGDGCAADCKSKGAGCVCTPGQLCKCPEVKCGNGILEGNEKCDDGNSKDGDGCKGDCSGVEKGYQCRVVGKACTPKCGDGVQSSTEACDDGNNDSGDGCSATCKLELGWKCSGAPSKCTSTKCGDNNTEGAEGCDDGNTVPFDGCSMDCQWEPDCKGSSCTSKCGDGIVLNEACDDGNAGSGDGCSKECQAEPGWTCNQPELGDRMLVPVVYRDFRYQHPSDFEAGVTGSNNASPGIPKPDLDGDGKPVYSGATGNAIHVESQDTFKQWYRDVSGVNHATAAKMTLWNNGNGGYVNRYGANGEQWNNTEIAYYCGTKGDELQDADGNAIPCTNKYEATSPTECTTKLAAGQEMLRCYLDGTTYKALFVTSKMDGNPLFFPVDGDDFTPSTERSQAKIPPYYDATATWPVDVDDAGNTKLHNFSFTSEVRYWFKYEAKKSYTLDFTGDDDVFVFVNKKLAVDLGGVHTPVNGTIVLNATGGGTVTVTPTLGDACTTTGKVTTCTGKTSTVSLGMSDNNVYEIAVFQAERQTTSSTYKLTLSGFNAAPSDCVPTCGDGVTVGDEECDCGSSKDKTPSTCAGPNGDPAYNGCATDCKWGPFCGDGQTTDDEECDNGNNNDDYGATNGCAPGCKLPARCGDGKVQTDFDEECDEGAGNLKTSDLKQAYGGCMSNCKRGGRCGDGVVNGPEQCDDGVNDGTYGTCTPECTPAPKCGDGVVQEEYAEECEPTMSNDPNCTPACRLPGGCGDGIKQDSEECDDGAALNNGDYGGCAPSCIFAPHCGDGIMNGPEQCDDGILDSSYGGCTPQCKLAPHCGDGFVNGEEECDHGADNGKDGVCSSACKDIIFLPL
jgi:fibro-slime domain-containing protein